ncbi:MAG TPA: urease accessory protein UreE [Polyangiaceae bacterium]|nr:urease accessory protein UreE [Polyangiaceae bacterium]
MRKILEKVAGSVPASVAVTLEYSERQKSRGLLKLDDGSEAALLLERGTGLQHGDRLLADDGVVVLVQAALEGLSIVTARDPLDLCRAAYHLGNRHVPLQISALRLAYLHDHVLDDMVRELGFNVVFSAERFEPESGAYGHGHAHASRPPSARPHAHPHAHEHDHEHDHEHRTSSPGRAHALP